MDAIKWYCVYCSKEVAGEHSQCCGEVGHTTCEDPKPVDDNPTFVHCPKCNEEHRIAEVTFLGIEENMEGHDVATYVCPVRHQKTKATVHRRR